MHATRSAHHAVSVRVDRGDESLDLVVALRATEVGHYALDLFRLDVSITIPICTSRKQRIRRILSQKSSEQPCGKGWHPGRPVMRTATANCVCLSRNAPLDRGHRIAHFRCRTSA